MRAGGLQAFLLLTVLVLPQAAYADDPRAAGGMLGWPQDEMARALGIFVPDRMKQFDVPGVAVAIVEKGAIVYAGTFGKADKGDEGPVTPDTLFQAHPSRRTGFDPGSRFGRSGVGFIYLQYVIERLTGEPLDVVAQSRVFGPLGLTQSHFLLTPETQAFEAQAYVRLGFLLTVFYVPFLAALVGLLVVFWALSRFAFQRRLEPLDYLWPVVGGTAFAMVIVWWGFGLASAVFIIGVALACAAVIAMLAGFAYYLLYIVGLARARDGIITRGGAGGEWIIVVLAGAIALGGFSPALKWSIPVAQFDALRGVPQANAATSFRTTAPDMARLMIALMDRPPLTRATRERLYADSVPAGGPFFWSLVTGVRRDGMAETRWMRGSVLGSESLMVMDPERRSGVVILTNSRSGGELAQDIARNVLGLEAVWSLP